MVSDDEALRIWLRAVHESLEAGQPVDSFALRIQLRDRLPNRFEPGHLPESVFRRGRLTALGIFEADPHSPWLRLLERLIAELGKQLQIQHAPIILTVESVADLLAVDHPAANRVLWLLSTMHRFHSWFKASPDESAILQLGITNTDTALQLISFTSFADYAKAIDEQVVRVSQLQRSAVLAQASLPAPTLQVRTGTVFILMQIDPKQSDLNDVLDAYTYVCERFGLKAERADTIEHQGRITDVILARLRESEFLIADLSGQRPNVYYEVGFAHALGKHPVLFRKAGTTVSFDLASHNVPEYENLRDLKLKLTSRLESMLGRSPKDAGSDSPPS